ncbi:MAG TPA: NapC/NirT family cytochrome c, partial [Gemmatimonadota bacterium]|nr:NapC/NirT family cytochrome c [Gemmatimonadota bacterium]
ALGGVPRVVQLLGGVVGIVLGIVVVALIVWRRRSILAWWRRRSHRFQYSVLGVVLAGAIAATASGAFVWDYMQNDNDFCNSCHIMHEPFERFQDSEHSQLLCHDCHQQSVFASARQLYLWVADRPEEIGPHAPVAREVCVECHVTEDPDSTWQRISATVGHRVHLEADTSALADVTCVTCHGAEVHRFVPADLTCGQSGCHDPGKTEVVLGEMAGQTGFHCVTCHEFTAPVPERAPLDTVRQALVPALEQCSSCHEMEKLLVGLDPEIDPHDAVCGTCHNPHTQEAPGEAANRCAECHAPADTLTPFHRGIDGAVLEDCVGCHEAHTFAVEGDDCVACHADIIGGVPTAGPRAPRSRDEESDRPPAGERTGREPALRDAASGPGLIHPASLGSPSNRPADEVARTYAGMRLDALGAALQQVPSGFAHTDHRDIACTDCHTSRSTHGEVTVESRGECLQCHHTRPVVNAGCARCHSRSELSAARNVSVQMSFARRTTSRALRFDHDDHASTACADCHTRPPTLAVSRTCASCHASHHTASADCLTCHRPPAATAHTRDVHTRGCAGSGCHEDTRYGAMTRGRNTCLGCHQDMTDHRPGEECAKCHRVSFAAGVSRPAAGR